MYSKSQSDSVVNSHSDIVSLTSIDDKTEEKTILSQCYPVRSQLEPYKTLDENLFGKYTKIVNDVVVDTCYNGGELQLFGEWNESFLNDINKYISGHPDFLKIYGIHRRYKQSNGVLFTITTPLLKRLIDMSPPSDEVGANFLRAPHKNCFLEFGSPEDRNLKLVTLNFEGRPCIVEGVYISEFAGNPLLNSDAMKQHFGLNNKSKYRVIELAVSFSPLSFSGEKEISNYATFPLVKYFTICVSDDINLNDCIKLNVDWLGEQATNLQEILPLVYNSILYIGLESKVSTKLRFPQDKKLNSAKGRIKPHKAHKNALRAVQQYSTIKLGSTVRYVSFSDFKSSKVTHGMKSPHLRRGHFAIRHKIVNGLKTPVITVVKPTIVHKELIDSDFAELLIKSYEVL